MNGFILTSGYRSREKQAAVYSRNPNADRFYKRLGFEEIGLRKNYYEEPKEHAVLMKKEGKTT